MFVECAVCETEFEARRSTARYCGDRCRQIASRRRRNGGSTELAEAAVDAETETNVGTPASNDGSGKDSELVLAVRKQLSDAGRLDTIEGQSAVLLAKQASQAGATGVSALIKELRVAVEEALHEAVLDIDCIHCGKKAMKPDVEDEVAAARKARERKASEAATR